MKWYRKCFRRLFIGRRYDDAGFDMQRRVVMMNVMMSIGFIAFCVFAVLSARSGQYIITLLDVIFCFILFTSLILMHKTPLFRVVSYTNLLLILAYFYYLFFSGGIDNTGIIWHVVYPLTVFFVLGLREGAILSLTLYAACLLTALTPLQSLMPARYGSTFLIRYFFIHAMVILMTWLFEFVRRYFHDANVQKTAALEKTLSDLRISEREVRTLAFYDKLTGLYNRAMFIEQVKAHSEHAKRYLHKLAVLHIGLDRFRLINDSMGHKVGDLVLKETGNRIAGALRLSDSVARVGADEFAVLLPNLPEDKYASNVAEKLKHTLREPFSIKDDEFHLTASIGVIVNDGRLNPTDVVKNAEIAMSAAKKKGKDIVCFYDSSMNATASDWISTATRMHHALKNEEFTLYYQPQIDLKNGTTTGVEALLRWIHPVEGFVPPDKFIPLAEESGLIRYIGLWVVREAIRNFAEWQPRIRPGVAVAINLSPRQFRNRDFYQYLKDDIHRYNLEPNHIELEFTEGVLIENDEYIEELLSDFHKLGVRLAIDDFGTGYSSLSYLKRFSVNTLKIDKSFIDHIEKDRQYFTIVQTIIMMAKNLNLKTVAEGVETAGQEKMIKDMGCDIGQGYYYSRPVDAEKIKAFIY